MWEAAQDNLWLIITTSLTTTTGWFLGRRERRAKVRNLDVGTEVATGDLILRWAQRLEAQVASQAGQIAGIKAENHLLRQHVWMLTQQLVNAGIVPAPPPDPPPEQN